MVVLNFSHPLTPGQIAALEAATGQKGAEIRQLPCQFDAAEPLAPQATAMVEAAGLTAAAWQTEAIVIQPPSHAVLAVAVLAEIHGRCGYFPPAIRLRPAEGPLSGQYEFAELVGLQQLRDAARARRAAPIRT